MNWNSIYAEVISWEGAYTFVSLPNLILIGVVLCLIWIGKLVFDLMTPYQLENELVKRDNKAISIAFSGYIGGLAIILFAVLKDDSQNELTNYYDLLIEIRDICAWGIIGILLLNFSGWFNDKIILRYFNNHKELITKRNRGTGAVVAGSYLGSAIFIRSIVLGDNSEWIFDLTITIAYFLLAQLAFFLFSVLYQKLTIYDLHSEIKNGNAAAGISFGFNLVAMGILLAEPLEQSYSIFLFLAWFFVGSSMLILMRFILNCIIIPSESLDREIHLDKNWGVALLEGCFSLVGVFLLTSIF